MKTIQPKRGFARTKKGSVTVFLTALLVSMLLCAAAFVLAARSVASTGYSDAVLALAGRSVLAEFDRRLKDEYGLFAFYGMEDQVEQTIRFYADSSFQKKLPGEARRGTGRVLNVYKLQLESVNADLAAYSIVDVDVFEERVVEYMNYMMAEKGIQYVQNMWKKNQGASGGSGGGGGDNRSGRTLNNRTEINSLPTKGLGNNGINFLTVLAGDLPSMNQVKDQGTKQFRVNEYIMSHFKYQVGGEKQKNTFFEYEVEYILYGKMSDDSNRRAFRRDFLLLRTALNTAHIYADRQKSQLTLAVAQMIAPGPAALAVQAFLIALWSAAEAENDARLLEAGHPVALFKTSSTWALGFQTAVSVDAENGTATQKSVRGYIKPRSSSGLDYGDYLRLFLFLERRETKLKRMMDLIQLNLRGSYYNDFLLKNYYVGFSVEAVVSGKKYSYEHQY